MGWSSGTEICLGAWELVRKYVPENKRVNVLAKLIDLLTIHDWDCVEEIEDEWPEAKAAIKKVIPEYGDED